MRRANQHCKIIKYADDTVIVGLIENNDEREYRKCIEYVADWCGENFLNLNVTKTKEMIVDFRQNKSSATDTAAQIDGKNVEIVPSYKYLGCTIQDNLKWTEHIRNQVNKANKRMYHVRCLAKLRVDNRIICMFYNAIVSSVLSYAIICWYKSLTIKEQKSIAKFRKKIFRLVREDYHQLIFDVETVHRNQCMSSVERIIEDASHPIHNLFNFLPSGERLNVTCYSTDRARNTFVPVAIKMYNS